MQKQIFNLSEVKGKFPLQGRGFKFKKLTFPSPATFFSRRGSGCLSDSELQPRVRLGRGGDLKPSEQSISPSLEFLSSLSCLGFAPRSQSSAFGTSCLSAPSVRYPDFASLHPSANPPFLLVKMLC